MEELKTSIKIVKVLKQVLSVFKHNMKNQFKNMNVTGPQGMLIGTLSHYGEMKISDLSEKLGLSNSTVSGIIDRLQKQGLVERIRSIEDRRVIYVSVTPKFSDIAQKSFKEVEESFEAMISSASQQELDTILKGLSTLEEIIERQKNNK